MPPSPLPHLYVDLDGTLVATDLLHESTLRLAHAAPLALLRLPLWLLRGKAFVKQQVAARVELDVATLPYRDPVLALIRRARGEGRRVVLATASDRRFAEAVAAHLGLFDAVLASDGDENLSGERKLRAIAADAAGHPFCYAADGQVDLGVWRGAQAAIVVSASDALPRRVGRLTRLEEAVPAPRPRLHDVLYGMRLHQWLKNLLVFVPLLPIVDDLTAPMLLAAVSMFFAFGLCASGIYVLNDLLDLESDRRHPRKRRRPFASGVLSIRQGIVLATALMLASGAVAFALLPPLALLVLAAYLLLTTAYSVWLKRRMLVDVFALAGLYTLRVLAGAAATGVEPSFWLLGVSMFMFLSLALAKRYIELVEAGRRDLDAAHGRAYRASDLVFVLAAGLASGQLSILTLSLYLNEPGIAARYPHPYALWLLCPLLLYWLVRVWLKAHRGELHDDPVVFAATDRLSQLIGAACVGLVVAASTGWSWR